MDVLGPICIGLLFGYIAGEDAGWNAFWGIVVYLIFLVADMWQVKIPVQENMQLLKDELRRGILRVELITPDILYDMCDASELGIEDQIRINRLADELEKTIRQYVDGKPGNELLIHEVAEIVREFLRHPIVAEIYEKYRGIYHEKETP